MRKREMALRIDELERRIRELEARPLPMPYPIYVEPMRPPMFPWQPCTPHTPIITWGTTTSGFVTDA